MHNERLIADMTLPYSGQPNVFEASFELGEVAKNYEVLSLQVTASQSDVVNFGSHRLNVKLLP